MFMVYALPVGLIAGWLTGGRLAAIGELRLRWAALALIGLLVQVVLFFGPVAERIGSFGTPIYVGSTALVLLVVLRNLAVRGLPLVALGAVSNLAAIVANGGSMPASPAALAFLDKTVNPGYSNSTVVADPALWILTDILAIPRPLPFANVFSIGDVLIAIGVAWTLAAAMRGGGASTHMPPMYPPARTVEP